jgi:mono/diheme cytochrome c family protein
MSLCASCHGDKDGRGGMPGVPGHGPSGHTWAHSNCTLERTIAQGQNSQLYPTAMPAWRDVLSPAQIRDVVAYLETWWTPSQRALRATRSDAQNSDCDH